MLPFPNTFLNPDINILSRLIPELPGLLSACVPALRNVLGRGGFLLPPSVVAATAKFRSEADPLRAFIAECIEWTGTSKVLTRNDIYAEYAMWASLNGLAAMSSMRFYEQLTHTLPAVIDNQILQAVIDGYHGWRGITIRK